MLWFLGLLVTGYSWLQIWNQDGIIFSALIELDYWVEFVSILSLIAEERNRIKNFQSHVSCSFDFYEVKILPQVNQKDFGPKYCKIPYFLIDQTEPFDFFTPLFTCNLCFLS